MEDLWAFNDEGLARAVYDCRIPVISAVGHETDFTVCDFVSDLRAPTPSAAAELAVPNTADILSSVDALFKRGQIAFYNTMKLLKIDFERNLKLIDAFSPIGITDRKTMELDSLTERMRRSLDALLTAESQTVQELTAKLEALNPVSVLNRGYTYVVNRGAPAVSSKDVKSGDVVDIVFTDGSVKARIV